ncbi:MAG: AbrB/MazE/SpoVT family DNA-binding domain-containing protein [Clostridia bacterium]|mgnify:CR=1 FL=1|nr:AbrB/MazE/SpoVT family DNA-binding domain-containing protein [Clostridia bacterium]
MKSTGIVRKVDELGRVVVPIEIRNALGIQSGDGLEIFVEGDKVILVRAADKCSVCGGETGLIEFGNKFICIDCIQKIKSL